MFDNLLYYSALLITVMAFISSLRSFRLDYSKNLKFFSILLGVTAFNEVGAWFIPAVLHQKNIDWYNIFMGIEFLMYGYFYYLIIELKIVKTVIRVYLWVFPVFWYTVVFFVFGIKSWNSYLAIAGSLSVVCFSLFYYYQLVAFAPQKKQFGSSAEFWIVTGLLVFYSCNMPYIGMLNFLVKNYLTLAHKIIVSFQVMYILTYGLFIYAFSRRQF